MQSKTVHLLLSGEALAALDDATTERKRGAWVSAAILAYADMQRRGHGAGMIEDMARRIVDMEDSLAKLLDAMPKKRR